MTDHDSPRIALPLYVRPDASWRTWTEVADNAADISFVVVDVANGPGRADQPVDAAYRAGIGLLQTAGIEVVGQVDLALGARPVSEVMADIALWRERFGVRAVMLGRALPTPDVELAFALWSARGEDLSLVVANPGCPVEPEWDDVADVVCMFEGDAAGLRAALTTITGQDPRRRWVIVHSSAPEAVPSTLLGAVMLAHHAYVTTAPWPHAYTRGIAPLCERTRARTRD